MLLRSISAPILNSWLDTDQSQLQRRPKSLSIFSSKSRNNDDNNETLISSCKQRRSSLDETKYTKLTLDPSSTTTFLVERLFSNSGFGEKGISKSDLKVNSYVQLETLVIGGGGGGGNNCNGGRLGGSNVDGGGMEDAIETYYKEMIELNPRSSLLTGNYAKYLKEVKGDMKKAEEYCERAILGKTKDGNVLSLYGDLILQNHCDRKRAHSYFQQAVQMSPEDCYVHASYARFLWDVEEDDEEKEDEQKSDETGLTAIYRLG